MMCKKMFLLISVLLVGLANAATVWNPAANGIVPPATGDWNDVANWTNGLPDNPDTDKAVFNVPDAAECIVSAAQTANQWVQGDGADGGVVRVISGGSLSQTQAKWSAVGYNAPARMIVEAGGLVEFSQHMWIGLNDGSVGTLDINGGVVTVVEMLGLGWNGGTATGYVNVNDGGLLALSNIHGDGASSIKGASLLSINGTGAVTLPGDFVGVINAYAAAGLIAGNGVLGAVQAVVADEVTTVTAVAPSINVATVTELEAAAAAAVAGDKIVLAEGTYAITSQIEIKDGVTYRGAGSGQTIIDCGGVTRAFVGWGDRSQGDDLPYSETGYPANTSGQKGWVIQGLSIINGVADDVDKSVLRVGDPAIDPSLAENVITDSLKSPNGGGICLENYAEGTLIDVAFENCNALATGVDAADPNATTYLGFGGALYMGWATANVIDCSFTGNNASNDGGAIHSSNPDTENWDLKIENSTFTSNRCRDDGGAISAIRRNLSLINCVIEDSKTGLDPNTMADNVSDTADGGFLWISGAGKVEGTSYAEDTPDLEMLTYGGVVNIVGSTFNNCGSRRGGAIRSNSAAQFNVTDSVFTNCTSTTDNDGGAIYANSPSPFNPAVVDVNDPTVGEPGVFIEDVTFDGCIASDDGGAIAVDNFSTTNSANYIEFPKVVINNTVVTNCRAGATVPDDGDRDGGGIYVNNQLDVTITNTVVENCTAGRHGAGIMVDGVCNSVLIDSVRVSNCSNDDISGEGGDGVALNMDQDDNAVVVVTNCIFDNNINIQDDAVVRIDGDIINVANCTFVGNTTTDKGILYFGTARADSAIVTNKAVNNLFVNNDSSPGSDNTINWSKSENNNITMNNAFFGTILDNDSEIKGIADADLGLTGNFIASADPLVDTAGGDYHLAAGSEAIDAGTAEDAPDHDIDGAVRPQGAAHDVGAYESPAN